MWRLRPSSPSSEVIDLDHPTPTAAWPAAPTAETWSSKRRRQEGARSQLGSHLSELDKQRQESVAAALQLYANPKEAGIKLLLPPFMDITDNPFTHCPTEKHGHVLPAFQVGAPSKSLVGYLMVFHPCRTRGTPLQA